MFNTIGQDKGARGRGTTKTPPRTASAPLASREEKRTQEGTRHVAKPRNGEFAWVRFAGGSWRAGLLAGRGAENNAGI